MAYRNDYQALKAQLDQLEQENQQLKQTLEQTQQRLQQINSDQRENHQRLARRSCMRCDGTLLPVAIFAGHDIRAPLPLSMSTLRFISSEGGFTHSAPVHSMACTSCGLIHNFVGATNQKITQESSESRAEK